MCWNGDSKYVHVYSGVVIQSYIKHRIAHYIVFSEICSLGKAHVIVSYKFLPLTILNFSSLILSFVLWLVIFVGSYSAATS